MTEKHSAPSTTATTTAITTAITTTSAQGPIGVFDSGIGGLSIAHAIEQQLPHESLLYVADHAYAPYGGRPVPFIVSRAVEIVHWLIKQGAKAIVVACNTATVIAIKRLRAQVPDVPIIGVEPGIKPAIQRVYRGQTLSTASSSTNKRKPKIAVLATANTVRGSSFRQLVSRHTGGHPIFLQACPGFADLVETGDWESASARQSIERIIKPLIANGASTFVLGCTHYIFLKPIIQALAQSPITLIDTSQAVARQVHRRLIDQHLLAPTIPLPNYHFYSTQLTDKTYTIVKNIWPKAHQISSLTL